MAVLGLASCARDVPVTPPPEQTNEPSAAKPQKPDDRLAPLHEQPGDAARGQAVFVSRTAGHCVLCHAIQGLKADFQGDVGPDLSSIGARLTAAQIRFRIVDAAQLNPDTIMPPYYRTSGLHQVQAAYQNQPALSASEVEDLVAFLSIQRGVP
ncbi:MAG: sulfur oxidation c-type cytochrome SoxX [Pseudomonadota bacterium]